MWRLMRSPAFESGRIIPDGKALILQLDPDDDQGEEVARDTIERQATSDISDGLQGQRQQIVDSLLADPLTDAELDNIQLQNAIRRAIRQSADLGVQVALNQFENVGLSFAWDLANEEARRWAENHTGQLITQVNDTTRRSVREAVSAWVDSGESLDLLIEDLEPLFGEARARLIAQTETTRAYTEANLISWREAGYGEGVPEFQPPLHPGCRCFLVIRVNDDGSAEYLYRTNFDSRVCPICSPHHETTVGIAMRADA